MIKTKPNSQIYVLLYFKNIISQKENRLEIRQFQRSTIFDRISHFSCNSIIDKKHKFSLHLKENVIKLDTHIKSSGSSE
jgi:hypothetical protein